ncbi:NUDIX domain-containing protein, partial [Streptomyces sp. NRRL S-15]|uniref:NUDIX domain-containing protein n=1 Tax=Streptomyces sp. NRRL S-15 TaxID=1463886 RepID=UPI00131C4C46
MTTDSANTPSRNTRPPLAQAALGVGVVVQDGEGRILLGRHRSGTWELPGGKVDPTHESVAVSYTHL